MSRPEIFELKVDYVGARWASPVDGADWLKVVTTPVGRPVEDWSPVAFEWTPGVKGKKVNDIVYCQGFVLALSLRAADLLGDLISTDGQLLEITGLEYILFRKTKFFDCLDFSASELVGDERRLSEIVRPVILAGNVGAASIFGLPQKPIVNFVTRPFVDAVNFHGLTGGAFTAVEAR